MHPIKRIDTDTTGEPAMSASEWTTFLIGSLQFDVCRDILCTKPGDKVWGRVKGEGWTSRGVFADDLAGVFQGLRTRLVERKARAFSGLDNSVKS